MKCPAGGHEFKSPVAQVAGSAPEYRADFLWPYDDGSVEEAGYEFANARTEAYRREWWTILRDRIAAQSAQNKE